MMQHLDTWLEACERDKEVKMVINSQTKIPSFTTHIGPPMETTPSTSTS
jgi:hypothetical protein